MEEQAPLRQQRILEVDRDNATATASEGGYAGWKTARDEILASASRPTLSVQTVTTLAPEEANDRVHVEIVTAPGRPERPRGRRFGVLVHAVLAAIDLQSSPEGVRAAAAIHGRLVDATHEEIEAAATAVQTALLHPLMRRAARAAGSDGLRRETPILLQRADGKLAEGAIDLAFREETSDFSGWTVVDFKTDREFEGKNARYTAQIALC